MAKRERKGRTWEGEVWKWGTDICPRASGIGRNALPSWITKSHEPGVYTRVRITEIVPKAKKASKRKGRK